MTELPELEYECETCGGNGIVTTAEWLSHDKYCKEARADWERGHPGESWYSSETGRNVEDGYPDECEEACADCDGTGSKVTEAGVRLLAFLRNHGKG